MDKLSIDLDKKLTIMSKYGLDAEEWLFIELLFVATEPEGNEGPLIKYFNECAKKTLPRETLLALKDKKILAGSYRIPKEGEDFDIDAVEFSKSFINLYFKESQEAGQEFFNTYPDFLQFGDKLLPARNITKGGFLDLNAFFHAYGRAIRNDPQTHAKVLDAIAWAIENELLCFGICEYLITRRWNDHIRMMESGEIGKYAVRVNTLEDI